MQRKQQTQYKMKQLHLKKIPLGNPYICFQHSHLYIIRQCSLRKKFVESKIETYLGCRLCSLLQFECWLQTYQLDTQCTRMS